MKKILITIIILMNIVSVTALEDVPTYRIIANSNEKEDIAEMYDTKEKLLIDYKNWVKGVDNKYQVLIDHQDNYNAVYQAGEYLIVLGKGQGKSLTGKLKVSYCQESEDIEKKSLFAYIFGN